MATFIPNTDQQKNPYLVGSFSGAQQNLQNVPVVGGQVKSPYDNLQPTSNIAPGGQLKPTSPTTSGAVDYTWHFDDTPQTYAARIGNKGYTPGAVAPSGSTGGISQSSSSAGQDQPPTGFYFATAPNGARMSVPLGSKVNPDGTFSAQNSNDPNIGSNQPQNQQGGVQPPPYSPYTVNNGLYGQLIAGLANLRNPNDPLNQGINTATQNLASLQKDYAGKIANIESQPLGLSEQQGSEGILNRQFAAQQAAAQGALTTATTNRQQQIGALESAAGLAQPQQAQPTNVTFNPATGQYGPTAASAFGTGGLQNIGNISGQINVGQNVAQLNSYLGGAQVVGNNLNDLITQNDINPVGLTYANGLLQFGANVMSDPAYRKFAGQINDFVASLAPILGVGGNVTDMKTQMSNQIVNGLQSGQTIKDVVTYFLQQAQQKIQGLSAGGGAGGSQQPTPAGGTAGGTQTGGVGSLSIGGYNYKQNPDGSWALVQ